MDIILKINWWKTFYFNFYYFPVKIAIRMPFFIYWRSALYEMKGEVIIDAPIRTGMVRFGNHCLGTQDLLYSRTIWEVLGTLIIKGNTSIGRGSKICIGNNAELTLGDGFVVTGNSEIICMKKITFGSQCLLSWDILLIDSDFHFVYDDKDNLINTPRPISIGNHVWIGCRNTILKGVSIADNVIISANSTITRSIDESNCIVGGHGRSVEIIKHRVKWKKDLT